MLEYFLLVSRRAIRGGGSGGEEAGDFELLANGRRRHFEDGTEFADHRVYVQGDDLRHLDWNLFARLDEQFVKRFEAETDRNIYFLLDCSASMQAGNGNSNKYDYARKIIAALAYIVLSDLHRVSVICFDDGVRATFPLTRGKGKFLNLLKFLEQNKPTGNATNIRLSVNDFVRRTRRAGVAVIVSDFFDRGNFQFAIDQLRYNKFEPKIIQLHADIESNPQLQTNSNLNLISSENESEINVTINQSLLNQYKTCFNNFLDELKTYCVKNNIEHKITNTSVPFDKLILKMIQ
jgi:uncharacterized protein (DUF58 family)